MYRLGLGDCFLLAFAGKQKPVYMLIDCGVHFAQPDGTTNMARVVDDLAKATGGHIDLVVPPMSMPTTSPALCVMPIFF